MAKNKTCLGCGNSFLGRKDAKTCSARCRKRLERHKRLLVLELIGSNSGSVRGYQPVRMARTALKKKVGIGKWKSLLLICVFLLFGLHTYHASALAEGYVTYDTGLRQGMAVSLSPASSDKLNVVQRADFSHPEKVLGISAGITDSLITTVSSNSKIYVISSGDAQAYVSDINGAVKKGDLLSLSPLAGILMKNTDPSQGVEGTALADFPSSYQTISAHNSSGKTVTAKLALVPMNVQLVLPGSTSGNNFLGSLGRSITGRDVGAARMAAAATIFLVLLVIEGTMAYSTVHNSLVAIGRNPLAGNMVKNQAIRSFGIAAIFLLLGSSVISIILWL